MDDVMASTDPTPFAPRVSPICADLRSKKTYFLAGPPMESSDVLDGSGHCWCRKTQTAIGPDGEAVDPEDCRAGRACFRSVI